MRLSQDPVDSGIKLSVSLAVGYLEDFYIVIYHMTVKLFSEITHVIKII